MLSRSISLLALASLVFGLAGCSGGDTQGRLPSPTCGPASTFCLISCNLGCSPSGVCAITEIAQNQPIVLNFSDTVDPASVDSGSVSIRTANGEAPVGRFVVDGATLTFVPEARISGGLTEFGFRANETYILTVAGIGAGATLRSASGDPLANTVLCTLRVTQGLIDLDGRPPSGELITPAEEREVPLDTPIVLRFSELLDISAFSGGNTATSPIAYQIRRTRPDPTNPEIELCDSSFEPVRIEGVPIAEVDNSTVPATTTVTLRPAVPLPKRVCVEVIVTEQLRDLSGTPAQRQVFRFFSEAGSIVPTPLIETFANNSRLDTTVSSGEWGGGRARPGTLGGSGIDGTFRATDGMPVGNDVFVWSTDSQPIPGPATLFGDARTVTGGQFEFTDFIIPQGFRVVFRGANPAIIRVRGRVQIDGELSVEGQGPDPLYNGASERDPVSGLYVAKDGELGAPGGPGGASGGQGADGCLGDGDSPNFDGRVGEPILPPAASGYASVVAGTGGGGGLLFPVSGLDSAIEFNLVLTLTGQCAGGGGGGAFLGDGDPGTVISIFTAVPSDRGPDSVGGTSVAPQLAPLGVSTFDHFLVGGAGGGGGGSQPMPLQRSAITFERREWHGGAAGAGGGGALAMRVGGTIDVNGTVSAKGGSGAFYTDSFRGPPSPGGGGSGGSLVFQVPERGRFRQFGTLDVSGGDGGRLRYSTFTGTVGETVGGAGGHGLVRLEAAGPATVSDLGTVEGPTNVPAEFAGDLPATESDDTTGFTSLWRATRQIFAPRFLYYRLVAEVDGNEVVYTDEPGPEFNPANQPGQPFRIWFQGGEVNAATNMLMGQPGPWRDFINGEGGRDSINLDAATGFRWMVMFDRTVSTDVELTQLEVWFEG